MQRFDPAAMAFTPFATNGGYTGAATTNAGAWNAVIGRALILDTFNDVLRSFGNGESGTGGVFATGVSAGGHSEQARLLQIAGGPAVPAVPAMPAWGATALAIALAVSGARWWRRR